MTPMGPVFHHTGSFTPMSQMQIPGDCSAGRTGPWRSVGTWFQAMNHVDENTKNKMAKDETATRNWPFGRNVQKVHGSLLPEHFFMGYRTRVDGHDFEQGSMKQSSASLWLVRNAYVER